MLWFGLVWLVGVVIFAAVGIAWAASVPLMRRHEPDAADHPGQYGLPCEEVSFSSRDGLALGGWWIAAPPAAARGTVILLAGQNGSLDKDIPQAVPLFQAGFNVLLFDWRAHGRSEGKTVTMGALEGADLLGALDDLEQKYEIKRVGLLGFSMGSGVALLTAAHDPRIAALVVDGAYPRLSGLLTSWGRLRGLPDPLARGLAWLTLLGGSLRVGYQLWRANPIDTADQIRVPVLFIHGEQDPFVSDAEIETLAGRISGPVDIWRVADAGHRESFAKHTEDYNRRIVAWFTAHLSISSPS